MSRRDVLALLRQREGDYVSGQEISDRLGLSRTAIWKAVDALRREGYTVEARTGRGYRLLDAPEIPLPSPQRVRSRTERWLSGQDDGVRAIRADNRERMLHLLIQKIENRKSKVPSRFQFADGMTYEEKYRQVAAWWGDFRFQLAMAVKSPSELNRFLAGSLSSETMYLLSKARKKGMPFFATPYYLSLLDVTGGGYDDAAIRSYILYSPQLVETYGQIRAWEREDVV